MIVYPPFIRPEAPNPAIARPMISMLEEVAAPQTADPTSKTAKKLNNAHFRTVSLPRSRNVEAISLGTLLLKCV